MDSIKIIAEIKLKPECREELIPVLKALVKGSRAEEGNKSYVLTENIDCIGHFFVVEEWESAKAIEEHNMTSHFKAFVAAIEGKAQELRITKLHDLF